VKSIPGVTVIGLALCLAAASAEDKRDAQLKELAAIKAELKPLREKAYLEPEVIATRRSLDEAYKAYWESVRSAMLRLDPSKKPLIEKDIAVRKEIGPVAGSRASDYAKKAAAEASPNPAK
jgi:hypothetical protein